MVTQISNMKRLFLPFVTTMAFLKLIHFENQCDDKTLYFIIHDVLPICCLYSISAFWTYIINSVDIYIYIYIDR